MNQTIVKLSDLHNKAIRYTGFLRTNITIGKELRIAVNTTHDYLIPEIRRYAYIVKEGQRALFIEADGGQKFKLELIEGSWVRTKNKGK